MLKWLKNKLDAWAEKEARGLNNFVAGEIRKQWKEDCPMLFKDD